MWLRLAVAIVILSLMFVVVGLPGIAYPFLLAAAISFVAAIWVSSEQRWRSLLPAMGIPDRQAAQWTPRFSWFLAFQGMILLAFFVLYFALANYPLIRLIDR